MSRFRKGIIDGIPIGLGYLSVSFTFGIMAVSYGLSWWQALLISMTNLTSAGQFAGLSIMFSAGTYFEMAITQIVINLRYSLMSISLSQKVDDKFTRAYRWLLGDGNTDEIFAVSMSQIGTVSKGYFAGLIVIPYIGWSMGTLLGALCGEILPEMVSNALGIAIYGMFIAILVPNMRKKNSVLIVVIIAVILSCCFNFIPLLKKVSVGFAIIICAVAAAAVGALVFPEDEEQ